MKEAWSNAFPPDTTIVTTEGYLGRVHLKVVAEVFNGKSEREKQNYIWDILNAELRKEAKAVSVVTTYSTDEL